MEARHLATTDSPLVEKFQAVGYYENKPTRLGRVFNVYSEAVLDGQQMLLTTAGTRAPISYFKIEKFFVLAPQITP